MKHWLVLLSRALFEGDLDLRPSLYFNPHY